MIKNKAQLDIQNNFCSWGYLQIFEIIMQYKSRISHSPKLVSLVTNSFPSEVLSPPELTFSLGEIVFGDT